ncbi:MAG: glycosyltransferase family 39 protein [Rhodobacter sp.]|nr:glycosyltransferase family 39 protein [Paracoccaceae bacterium]MCC0075644.1 glycosyltransferase family 39 protein [Rhodobacter sp.]
MPTPADRRNLLILMLVTMAIAVTVDLRGDFAINDDWGYSTPIRWWSEGVGLHLTNWQSMPLLTQLAAGMGWSALFGFGQGALRALTMVFALGAAVGAYGIVRVLKQPEPVALVAALALFASPVFVGLGVTFMSDIPGAALVLAAAFAFALALSTPLAGRAWRAFAAGTILTLLALALRQTAIALPLALVAAVALDREVRRRFLGPALALLIVSALSIPAFEALIARNWTLPVTYHAKTEALIALLGDLLRARPHALRTMAGALALAVVQIGLFCLPLLPLLWPASRPVRLQVRALTFAGALAVVALTVVTGMMALGGTTGDILTPEGIGPRLIGGAAPESPVLALLATLIGAELAALLFLAGWAGFADKRLSPAVVLLLAAGAITYAPHALAYAAVFDRYALLPAILVTLGVIGLLPSDSTRWSDAALVLCAILAVGATALTRDFMDWQRHRYALVDQATTLLDLPADQIDAGFEANNLVQILANPEGAATLPPVFDATQPYRLSRPVEGVPAIAWIEVDALFGLRRERIDLIAR